MMERANPAVTLAVVLVLAACASPLVAKQGAQHQHRQGVRSAGPARAGYDASCPSLPDPKVWPSVDLASPALTKALSDVDAYFQSIMSEEKFPGMVATVVFGGRVVWTKGYGNSIATDPTSPPPTKDTLVMVASITKVFTAALLYKFHEQGIVGMDDPVSKHMPGFVVRGGDTDITMRQLASHTAGLPREVPYPCSFSPNCTEEFVLDQLSQRFLVMQPSTRFHYSNLGFALLGRALAHAANRHFGLDGDGDGAKSFEEWLHDEFTAPLGMNSTFKLDAADMVRWPLP